MAEVDWDEIAKKADEGIPGQLAFAHRLYDEGKLEGFVLLLTYRNRKDTPLVHAWWRKDGYGMEALGLLEYAKATLLKGFLDDPGYSSDEEAEEAEPNS